MSIPHIPRPSPSITLLPTELWLLIIANLDLPSLEKAICAFYSLFRTLIEPQPTMLPWLSEARGTAEWSTFTKFPFEVLDSIFQNLEPQDKVAMAVSLWVPRKKRRREKGDMARASVDGGSPSSQSDA